MKSNLIKVIQDLAGVVSVEPFHIAPDEPDQLFCIVTFDEKELRLSAEEVQQRNYSATERRSLITEKTSVFDFCEKIGEELGELTRSCEYKTKFDASKLAKISNWCDNMALHYAVDLQKEKELQMIANESKI